MPTTPHTAEVKALAAALYAFLADFCDYDGPTFARARAALHGAGFAVENPPGAAAAARVKIEVRGGVATYESEGAVEVELIDHDDAEQFVCSACANSEAEGAESAECEECELCVNCCPHKVSE